MPQLPHLEKGVGTCVCAKSFGKESTKHYLILRQSHHQYYYSITTKAFMCLLGGSQWNHCRWEKSFILDKPVKGKRRQARAQENKSLRKPIPSESPGPISNLPHLCPFCGGFPLPCGASRGLGERVGTGGRCWGGSEARSAFPPRPLLCAGEVVQDLSF